MFKLISAETKKIVSKPGIYILSVLLAIILIVGVFMHNPKESSSTQIVFKGSTYVEKYNDFTANNSTIAGKKVETDNSLKTTMQTINNYFDGDNGEVTKKEHIESLIDVFEKYYAEYQDSAHNNADQKYIDLTRTNIVTSLENLNDAITDSFLLSHHGSFPILSTEKNYNNYKKVIKEVLAWSKVSVAKIKLSEHCAKFENEYSDKFYSCLKNFKYPTLSQAFVKDYTTSTNNSRLAKLQDRLNVITNEMNALYEEAKVDVNVNINSAHKFDELANSYINTTKTFVNLVKYELICNAFSCVSTKEELTTLHLSNYSNYNSKSLLKRYEYLFNHNKNDNDFAQPLTIGQSSNNQANAYDYSYFILKVFAFVIIIYAIMSSCHTIAGELKEGSLRYLAIRPVSRTKLLLGKWFAILIMCAILTLFSLIISLCVGGAVYGFSSKTILTIFNGNVAFTIHPLGMIGIYLLSMMCELIIYSLIAMLLSVLIKSDLASMTVLIVVYLLNTLLPMFVQGANSWLAYYPFSHISLYSLFGSSLYANKNNFFNLMFGAKVYAGTHIALTISMIVLITVIVGFVAIRKFKKKEL